MNSCGLDYGLDYSLNFCEDPEEKIKEYKMSEWLPTIIHKDIVKIPLTFLMKKEDLFNCVIDILIDNLPNKECFARLDQYSSKPEVPFKSSKEIIKSLSESDRTYQEFETDNIIIIREWIHGLSEEFRCFVHGKTFRAISTKDSNKEMVIYNKNKLREIIHKITHYSEYDDYTADFSFDTSGNPVLIEINTPVYLCASSGKFDLSTMFYSELLLGEYIPEVLNYPIIK